MIYTVTLNPALDVYLSFDRSDQFAEGKLNLPKSDVKRPGGKGINVANVLKKYNIDSKCLGFIGGFVGDFIVENLNSLQIKSDFIKLDEDTRINIKLNNNGLETEIAGISPNITQNQLNQFLDLIKKNVKTGDILVLSGSVPASVNNNIYAQIIDSLAQTKQAESVKIILDSAGSKGSAFDQAIRKKVHLVKPNKHELETYFSTDLSTQTNAIEIADKHLIKYGKELQKLGAENVLISLGKEGSIFISRTNQIYKCGVPNGNLISSVGAGDSMVAGYIYGLVNNFSVEDTYKFAVSSGSGTAFSQGFTTLDLSKKLFQELQLQKIC